MSVNDSKTGKNCRSLDKAFKQRVCEFRWLIWMRREMEATNRRKLGKDSAQKEGLKMKLRDFKEMINRTVFCALSDKDAHFRGVLLKRSEGKLVMVATNNRVLGFASSNVGDDFPDFGEFVVPPEVLQKIAKRKRDTVSLSISVSNNEVNFRIGSACVSAETVSGNHPQFVRILENIPTASFAVDRLLLLEALDMISATRGVWGSVYFALSSGTLILQTDDENSSAEVEVPCDYSGEKADLTFSMKYITEIIKHIDTERVSIRFGTRNITVAIMPVPEQGYFFLLAQKRRNGT